VSNIEKYRRIFERLNYGNKSDIDMFVEWCIKNDINRLIETCVTDYRKVTRNGLRGIRNRNCGDFPFRDHSSLWINNSGFKILVSQPYCLITEDCSSNVKKELDKWCIDKNLLAKVHDPAKSWYYPDRTLLIEIIENNGGLKNGT
jgi:hypothetical protein